MLLVDLALIIVLARAFGVAARKLGQPAVVGEVLAGIAMGPSLLGGWLGRAVLPADVRPYLGALANVGVAVFMFIVGLEFDRRLLRRDGRAAVTVSIGSLLAPFALGTGLACYLATSHPSAHRLGFVLFIGAAMSVTAFPVLARILTDNDMRHTRVGRLALASAALGDVLAWVLLAGVVAIVTNGGQMPWRLLLTLPYSLVMLWVVRPLLRRLTRGNGQLTGTRIAIVLIGLLVSAGLTEWLGLHFIFGAFLFGAIMPTTGADRLREQLLDRIGPVSSVLLLPVFFVIAGLGVNLSDLSGTDLIELGLIMVVAVSGKFAGVLIAARLHRLGWRDSAALAALMDTRGLTELIILSVGLSLGVLDHRLYSLMVVMAVATTAITGPLLHLIYPRRLIQSEIDLDRRQPVPSGN